MARKKSKEEWKTYANVFDNFTLRNLHHLENNNYFDELTKTIQVGKEANVFIGISPDKNVAVKIYRLENCNFNKMLQYIKSDPRFPNIRPQKRDVIFSWVQREYRNLLVARQAGIRVPTPIINKANIIVEELIGEDDTPAPQLKDADFENVEEIQECFDEVLNQMKKLWNDADIVHADLSEFNILYYEKKPILIDFSQSTSNKDYHANEYLERDLNNIIRFFSKFGLKKEIEEIMTGFKKIKIADEEFFI